MKCWQELKKGKDVMFSGWFFGGVFFWVKVQPVRLF